MKICLRSLSAVLTIQPSGKSIMIVRMTSTIQVSANSRGASAAAALPQVIAYGPVQGLRRHRSGPSVAAS